jgi:1-acyl-sn-glycerol-3-phosphate acyltransferase
MTQTPETTGSPSTVKSSKPANPEKLAKNLYEPYVTPMWFWRSLRAVARFLFRIVLDVKISGQPNVPPQGACIIASNHLSWTDVPLVPAFMRRPAVYMAKEELFYGKMGWLVRLLGAFPVKRGEADRQSLRTADTLLKAGKILIIFPEGTRSKIHQMAKGHEGLGMIALRSGAPVIPVAITGSEHALKKFRPPVTVTFGEPMILQPKGNKITREDIEEATAAVMHRIAQMLPPQYRGVYAEEPETQSIEVESEQP